MTSCKIAGYKTITVTIKGLNLSYHVMGQEAHAGVASTQGQPPVAPPRDQIMGQETCDP